MALKPWCLGTAGVGTVVSTDSFDRNHSVEEQLGEEPWWIGSNGAGFVGLGTAGTEPQCLKTAGAGITVYKNSKDSNHRV